jgi:hypothetical protein
VGLDHPVEPGPLELAVNVRREHPHAMRKTFAPVEASIAAEIGQPRVDAHARARAHEQRVGLAGQPRRRIQRGRIQTCLVHFPLPAAPMTSYNDSGRFESHEWFAGAAFARPTT